MRKKIRETLEAAGMDLSHVPENPPRWDDPKFEEKMEERHAEQQKAADAIPVTYFTFNQVQRMMQDMMEKMSEMNRDSLVSFAKEMKRPSAEEEAKEFAAKERREKLMNAMIESAKAETAERERIQNACNHRKPNGIMNFGGQVHGDRVRLICKTCFKELVNRKAGPDDMQVGPLELLVENQRMGLNS